MMRFRITMKYLLILSLGCFLTVTKANPYLSPPYKVQRAIRDCKNELSMNLPNIDQKLSLNGPVNFTIFDPKYACLNKCILEKSGILSTTGELITSAVPSNVESIGTECYNASTSMNSTVPTCDRAHNLTVCLIQKLNDKLNQTIMDCASETNTRLDRSREYRLKEFLNVYKYNCMNRCVLIRTNKFNDENDIKIDMLRYFAPENANIPEIVRTCTDYSYTDQCKTVVKRELCVQKVMQKLGKDMLKG